MGVRVVGIGRDDLETPVAVALRETARERTFEGHGFQREAAVLAEVVAGGVLDSALRAGTRIRPVHGPMFHALTRGRKPRFHAHACAMSRSHAVRTPSASGAPSSSTTAAAVA